MSINQSEPLILFEGMSLQLNCLASGAPFPTIMWSRRGMTFDPTNSRLQLIRNSLTIDDVMQNDTGRYFCCATSSAGTAAASIEVAVVMNQTIPVTIATTGESQPHFYTHTITILTKPSFFFIAIPCYSVLTPLTHPPSPITTHTAILRPHLSPFTPYTHLSPFTPPPSPLTPPPPPSPLTPHTLLM